MGINQCQEVLRHLAEYVDDELSQELKARIEAHLEKCAFCRNLVKSYQKTINLFKKAHNLEPDKNKLEKLKNYLISNLFK